MNNIRIYISKTKIYIHYPILIAYGSQTGSAQQIATKMHEVLQKKLVPQTELLPLCTLNDAIKFLKLAKTIIVVVSNTGRGDFPDNASKFIRVLKMCH